MNWTLVAFWLVLPVSALIAGMTLFRQWSQWRFRKNSAHRPLVETPSFEVKFEITESSSIRSLLGDVVADSLLDRMIVKVSQSVRPAVTITRGPDSISLTYPAELEPDADDEIAAIGGLLSNAFCVAGIEFNCRIKTERFGSGLTGHSPVRQAAATDIENRRLLLHDLNAAIAENLLTLEYQPKADLRGATIDSAEALLRWRLHDASLNIAELIQLTESTGTIKQLTLWTLRQAIADGVTMHQKGCDIEIFVNISGGLLADQNFVDDMMAQLSQTDVRIGIEITETAVIADPMSAIENLQKIANAGISVAIDDFGAGLSSLEYLQQLPAAELKIDRNFIATLSSSNRNPLIVKASIDLAHAMEMKVTAEGVDDPLSFGLLKVMGCDMVQGYLISPAVPVDQLVDFINAYAAAPQTGSMSIGAHSAAMKKEN